MRFFRYNWLAHASDERWTQIIVIAEDRATADQMAAEQDRLLSRCLTDTAFARRKHYTVEEQAIKPGVAQVLSYVRD